MPGLLGAWGVLAGSFVGSRGGMPELLWAQGGGGGMPEVLWARGVLCRNFCGLGGGMPELLWAWGGVCRNFCGLSCCCCCCEGTQHVPAGETARHALPGQGAREQSAGVTLAGRVPTTTGGGGGGAPWSRGGGACGGGWGYLWKLPWSPPPSCGGRVTRPVRSGCGGGGGRGGDLGVGKARPGPRTLRALPEHPAEVAVARVRPWRGRGRWPVRLAFYGGEGRPGSCFLPAPSHLCLCCGVAASSPVVRARARVGHGGGRAQGR